MPSFQVTLYSLFLGGQDGVTGQYVRGYAPLTITMYIEGKGRTTFAATMGIYSRYDAIGFTNYQIKHGDIIKDEFDEYFLVAAEPQAQKVGTKFVYFACQLEQLDSFPYTISTYYGFEEIDDSHKFEDGFERGYWEP